MLKLLISTPVLTFLAVVLLIVFKYVYSRLRGNSKSVKFAATLPGPPALPIIGNTLDLFFARSETLTWFMECEKKYGSIFRMWFGRELVVYLSDVDDIEYVLRNPKMQGRPAMFQLFRDFFGEGLFTSTLDIWRKTRKLQQSAYTPHALASYVPDFNDKIYELVETLEQFVDGPEFDVDQYLPFVSFDIIAKTALGVDIYARDKESMKFAKCIRTALEMSIQTLYRPWLQIKSVRDWLLRKKITMVRKVMLQLAEELVTDRFEQLQKASSENDDSEPSSVTPFMQAAHKGHLAIGNETLLRDEVATVLTAGTDTVAITNAFCLLVIAANPDIQDKIYDEIYEVFGDGDRPADKNDLNRLPYLTQVVKETMRLYPLSPIIFKNAEEDCQIGSRIFPAGTAVLVSTWSVHRNPKYYPNPKKFNPENFAPDAVEKRSKLTFLNFGAGTRNCIGMNYAYLQVKLTLVALLRAYQFRTTIKLDELKMILSFNIRSADGYRMSITRRDRRPSYMRDVK